MIKRVVFIGTGDIALPAFRRLLANGIKPLALVTQPDKPAGRKMLVTPPRIKSEALAAGIPVMQPEQIGDAAHELAALEPELIVVMAYGQILRNDILNLPSRAIINLHASLLPKYRGAACIQAAIDAGDAESGVTSMHVVRKLDAGDMIFAESVPIQDDETGGSLHDKLAAVAADVLMETLIRFAAGGVPGIPQCEADVSYVGKLGREDGRIDWSMTAEQIERRIRAYDPWPGTFTLVKENGKIRRLKILPPTRVCAAGERAEIALAGGRMRLACGSGVLEILRVQPEGGSVCQVGDYLRGRKSVELGAER